MWKGKQKRSDTIDTSLDLMGREYCRFDSFIRGSEMTKSLECSLIELSGIECSNFSQIQNIETTLTSIFNVLPDY
jgi:hypothetical protein